MTDFSILDRNADDAFQEVQRFLERAEYYKEQKDYTQALTNYAKALQSYAKYARWHGESIGVKMPIDISLTPRETARIYSKTLFDLAVMLSYVINCYTNSVEQAFFEAQVQKIDDELSKYQTEFDADQLRKYDKLKAFVNENKAHIQEYLEAIEELEKKPVKQLDDPFRLLKTALADISYTKVCPIRFFDSGGCFIATAAYMTSTHPDLDTFRAFRDKRLLSNSFGKLLVHIYYRTSPALASYINSRQTLRDLTKRQLKRLAQWMREKNITD